MAAAHVFPAPTPRWRAARARRSTSPPARPARASLTDGGGPPYVRGLPGDLRAAALRALFALDGSDARR